MEQIQKNLEKINIKIPRSRHLQVNDEIENFIKIINTNIINELHKMTPKHKSNDSITRYTNKEIKYFQVLKSKVLSEIHKLYKKFMHNGIILSTFKKALEMIRNKLKTVFNKNVNNYWFNRISKIKCHDSQNMFPQIKAVPVYERDER